MLVDRISAQLKQDQNITKKNLVNKLTSIGLKLEYIIATATSSKNSQNDSCLRFYYVKEKEESLDIKEIGIF